MANRWQWRLESEPVGLEGRLRLGVQ